MPDRIRIEVEDESLRRGLRRLHDAAGDMSPVMRRLSRYLAQDTAKRFIDGHGPDGVPWAPWSPVTIERRARKGKLPGKILIEDVRLLGSLEAAYDKESAAVGTNLVYAPTHQFGARRGAFGNDRHGRPIPWGDIPARPFLGFDPQDAPYALAALNSFLENAALA